MKPIFLVFILGSLFTSAGYSDNHASIDPSNKTTYLKKPTGPYGVGFEDFHWVNQNACPDFNFNGKNQADFSPENTKHCHEIVARIYYPTLAKSQPNTPYYPPLIASEQQTMPKQFPTISKSDLKQLTKIKSFSSEKAAIIKDKQFPVLLFSPGFGCPTELYENFITELVSQGYIVIGINTPFINLVALPNGHIVRAADFSTIKNFDKVVETKFVPLQSQDLIYVYDKLHEAPQASNLFSNMDLKHIGVFGHSIGARALADVAHAHPSFFQAIAPLDIGFDNTGQSLKKFITPVMYQISSNRKQTSFINRPIIFELGNNGYLVGISPNEKNTTYSQHMNFTDFSSLQYLPAYKAFYDHLKTQDMAAGFNLKLIAHNLTKKDIAALHKTTYVLSKQAETWSLFIYDINPYTPAIPLYFDINRIDGLPDALAALANHPIGKLTEADIGPIKKIITSLNSSRAAFLGTGNGWEITDSINTYLVQFFNIYLKGEENPAFKKCIPLYKNTHIKCGLANV